MPYKFKSSAVAPDPKSHGSKAVPSDKVNSTEQVHPMISKIRRKEETTELVLQLLYQWERIILIDAQFYQELSSLSFDQVHWIFKRKFRLSAFHQLGFALEKNFIYLQGILLGDSVKSFNGVQESAPTYTSKCSSDSIGIPKMAPIAPPSSVSGNRVFTYDLQHTCKPRHTELTSTRSMTNSKRAHADDDEVNGDGDSGPERPWKQHATTAFAAPQPPTVAPFSSATAGLNREHIAFFATHGFVVLSELLADDELRFLQQECALLYDQIHRAKEDAVAQVIEQDVLQTLLFERLPSFAAQLMARSSDAEEDSTSGSHELLFFNEHYVVKPPQTAVEFRWHRDDDEQLGMCVHRALVPPYISAWCALDGVTLENGPLRFVSQSSLVAQSDPQNGEEDGNESEDALEAMATAPILVPAGTVIFFLSNVWHCSSANESQTSRRAFYAQYSQSKITASPADPWPLSFAIPCEKACNGAAHEKDKVRDDAATDVASPDAESKRVQSSEGTMPVRAVPNDRLQSTRRWHKRCYDFLLVEDEGVRGDPGALFREEWNSMAVNAQKNKTIALYRHERDVNPTPIATVNHFYDVHASQELARHVQMKGNTVSALKSATPRFNQVDGYHENKEIRGPGAYSPERFCGAFPVLLAKVSPRTAMQEKQSQRLQFETEFAIGPPTGKQVGGVPGIGSPPNALCLGKPPRPMPLTLINPVAEDDRHSLASARLSPAFTPRTAYQHGNRQLLLRNKAAYQGKQGIIPNYSSAPAKTTSPACAQRAPPLPTASLPTNFLVILC
ncbi:Phytanoyl-coa dioxygenase, partial [Globisporangium splendens]